MSFSSLLCGIVLSVVSCGDEPAEDPMRIRTPEKLMAALQAKDVQVARVAFRPFANLAKVGVEYRPALRMGLKHDDQNVRVFSALGLSASGEASEPVIQEILKGLGTRTQFYIADIDEISEWSLAKQGVVAMPVLLAALKHESASVRYHALRAIEAIGPPARDAWPLVVGLVDEKEPGVKRRAIMAKWRIDGDDRFAVDHLVPLLSEARERKCNGAVDCLKRMGPGARRAIPALLAAMKQHKDTAVIEAVGELGPLFSWSVGGTLRRSLADPEMADRVACALLHIDGPMDYLLPHLARMMNHDGSNPIERHELARVLGEFGPKAVPAMPGLIRTLKSPSGQTRINAAETLGKIGPDAKEALPALRESLADADAAAAAKDAIAKIEKNGNP